MAVSSCSWLEAPLRRRGLALALLASAALGACGPVYRAQTQPGQPAAALSAPQVALAISGPR